MPVMNSGHGARSVLLVAYHFPPFAGSSGSHRTLALARYLHEFGWTPMVLTVRSSAYESVGEDAHAELPEGLLVRRTVALDAGRHLAIRGRYPRFLSLPDRWVSWLACAIPVGLALVARHRPAALWTTFPLATAHLIGSTLHRLTGLPWVADFRDPMVEYIGDTWFPRDPAVRRSRLFVERRVAHGASAVTFCTDTAREIFVHRHGWQSDRRPCAIVENGFDESDFAVAGRLPSRRNEGRIHLVHSGTLYPGPDRDPGAVLEALANLRDRGRLPERFRLTLRATGFDDRYRPFIEQLRLGEFVALAPPLPYHDALREILDADGLLLIQGYTSNPAIPAKAYEYLRAGRPILALVDTHGETAALLRRVSVGTIAQPDDREGIERALEDFLRRPQQQPPRVLSAQESARFARRERVRDFAALLERVAMPGRPASS
jgi:hypothetical protein